ncbi:UbiD family decarboxylase [Alkalicoccus chagannorensis]|uniref:UbiD family decarboxylase n=1 Tax=Alkalicoccus chagannorensis TaxID=427072 RepID=UPI000412D80E|nr:UbiD family decarboxylase [Alkalicoccus chagannorensis]
MIYRSTQEVIHDLEHHGHLVRIQEEVDPHLEMASLHLKMYEAGGPALYFENVKGSSYPAVSNLFGTIERSEFIFRRTLEPVKNVMEVRNDPAAAMKKPWRHVGSGLAALNALPFRRRSMEASDMKEIQVEDLPLIQHWPDDGGAFITLPQVYTEDPDKPGVMNANVGMYRVQLSGNEFDLNKEAGMHYQIHRGIGVHQSKAKAAGKPLKVSIFVGGPPAHTLAAVMPLPEGLSELTFAGLLAGRRFRYTYDEHGSAVSLDADFVITGEIYHDEVKPEGPFGDHLGYYSLTHDFPVLRIDKVYARENAVWPFTVVGRPPQEDTTFGAMIHELTGGAVKQEIPGVKEVHAVDAAGVHPLLLAVGSERYTPYAETQKPAELLTIAHRILGTGQLSLAKYVWITGGDCPSADDEEAFFQYMLERMDLRRDLHFHTNTTIDTLDYTSGTLNEGSKVVLAAYGSRKRELQKEIPAAVQEHDQVLKAETVMPGIAALELQDGADASAFAASLSDHSGLDGMPLLILTDDAAFTAASIDNFVWTTFTRSNPSQDMHGTNAGTRDKHWGCDQMIIDARRKAHHAPPLIPDRETEEKVKRFFDDGGPLAPWKKDVQLEERS